MFLHVDENLSNQFLSRRPHFGIPARDRMLSRASHCEHWPCRPTLPIAYMIPHLLRWTPKLRGSRLQHVHPAGIDHDLPVLRKVKVCWPLTKDHRGSSPRMLPFDVISTSKIRNFPVCNMSIPSYIYVSKRFINSSRIVQGWMLQFCSALCSMLIEAQYFFWKLFVSARTRLSIVAVLFGTLTCMMMGPISCNAASLCLPVPTLQGIGHVCIDVGKAADNSAQLSREPEPTTQIPSWVNAQQIPCGSQGNVFTRAGFRPQTLVRDTMARIRGAAAQRLEVIRSMESESEGKCAGGPLVPRIYTDVFSDPFEDHFGAANIPRSQILADTIDPFILTVKTGFVVVVFRRS
jgi:hypothetical protein